MKKVILVIVILAAIGVAAWRFWPEGELTPEMIAQFTDPTVASELGDELGQLRLQCVRCLESENLEGVIEACDGMIKKDRHNALTRYVRSAALFKLDRPEEALKDLEAGGECPASYFYFRRCFLDNTDATLLDLSIVVQAAQQLVRDESPFEPERHLEVMDDWALAGRRICESEPLNAISFMSGLGVQWIALKGKADKLRELGRAAEADKADALDGRLDDFPPKLRAATERIDKAMMAQPFVTEREIREYGYAKSIERPEIQKLIPELDRIWQEHEQ